MTSYLTDISHRLAASPTATLLLFTVTVALPLHALIRGRKLLVWLPGPPAGKWTTGERLRYILTVPDLSYDNQLIR